MPEREQGGIDSRQWPQTAADLAELEREAADRREHEIVEARGEVNVLCVSDHLEVAGACDAFKFNGREAAAYVLGFWQRHLRDAASAGYYDQPEAERLGLEVLAVIHGDHLPAVCAVMVRAGARVDILETQGDRLTLRIIAPTA